MTIDPHSPVLTAAKKIYYVNFTFGHYEMMSAFRYSCKDIISAIQENVAPRFQEGAILFWVLSHKDARYTQSSLAHLRTR